MVSNAGMKVIVVALLAISVCVGAPCAPTLVACACGVADTVCLSDLQMFEHATHIEMDADRMGKHSNYQGVAVFQIGFDERGHVTGAEATSGHPLGVSYLIAAVSRWKFKPIMLDGVKKRGCGRLWIKFAMRENVPSAEVLRGPKQD